MGHVSKEAEKYRYKQGQFGTKEGDDFGLFIIKTPKMKNPLKVIVAPMNNDECKWEHVSVSKQTSCPTWEEMCYVKNLFWSKDEVVVQFHPDEKNYIDTCGTCLHMWRNKETGHELPPSILV